METSSKNITKKFINNPATVIDENLRGFIRLYPQLKLYQNYKTIVFEHVKTNNVGVISGGGGGHEPFAAGFVGNGMLTAAVSGSVFASPPPANILHAIKCAAANNKGGVIVIIPNYTGDRLNFGLAIERAKSEGIQVESVIVNDDCALIPDKKLADDELHNTVGARGLAGLIFIHKIAGAMSVCGQNIKTIVSTLHDVLQNIASMGVCVRASSIPGQPLLFELANDEMELGVGVHGEAGCERAKFTTLKNIINILLNKILKSIGAKSGDSLAVIVNNLGGTSKIEEHVVVEEVYSQLSNAQYCIQRIYSGPLMTSLEMAGVQLTILKILDSEYNKWLKYLDDPTDAPAWPGRKYSVNNSAEKNNIITQTLVQPPAIYSKVKLTKNQGQMLQDCLTAASNIIIEKEEDLNGLDSGVGDGDCGSTLTRLAKGLLNEKQLDYTNPSSVFRTIAQIAENDMGGTSGGIYSLFATAIATTVENDNTKANISLWSKAIQNGLESVMKYTKAKKNDRTLLDVLIPVNEYLQTNLNSEMSTVFTEIRKIAQDACKSTQYMKAKVGRAAYVNFQNIKNVDAGAYGVQLITEAIIEQCIKYFKNN